MRFNNLLSTVLMLQLSLGASVKKPSKVPKYYTKLLEYAEIASISYCVHDGLSAGRLGDTCPTALCKKPKYADIEVVKVFDSSEWGQIGSGFYAVDHKAKRVMLVFRGTANRREMATNLDFLPAKYTPMTDSEVDCDGCKAHQGFFKFLQQNHKKIIGGVVSLKDKFPKYKLVVVGHSLGAALAILTGIEFQLKGYEPLVISYAGPKLGNSRFVDFVNEIFETDKVAEEINKHEDFNCGLIRLVHTNDMVTNLPPSPVFQRDGYEFCIDKRDLPHEPEDVMPMGSQFENSAVALAGFGDLSPRNIWSSFVGSYEHSHYLIKITGCRHE